MPGLLPGQRHGERAGAGAVYEGEGLHTGIGFACGRRFEYHRLRIFGQGVARQLVTLSITKQRSTRCSASAADINVGDQCVYISTLLLSRFALHLSSQGLFRKLYAL